MNSLGTRRRTPTFLEQHGGVSRERGSCLFKTKGEEEVLRFPHCRPSIDGDGKSGAGREKRTWVGKYFKDQTTATEGGEKIFGL